MSSTFCLRQSTVFYSNLRHPTAFYGILRHSTAFYGIYGILRRPTAFYGTLRHFTALYGILRQPTAFYGMSTAFYGILRHVYGILWHVYGIRAASTTFFDIRFDLAAVAVVCRRDGEAKDMQPMVSSGHSASEKIARIDSVSYDRSPRRCVMPPCATYVRSRPVFRQNSHQVGHSGRPLQQGMFGRWSHRATTPERRPYCRHCETVRSFHDEARKPVQPATSNGSAHCSENEKDDAARDERTWSVPTAGFVQNDRSATKQTADTTTRQSAAIAWSTKQSFDTYAVRQKRWRRMNYKRYCRVAAGSSTMEFVVGRATAVH
jgi:hypothetical protein